MGGSSVASGTASLSDSYERIKTGKGASKSAGQETGALLSDCSFNELSPVRSLDGISKAAND